MHLEALEPHQQVEAITNALERNEFILYYQPQLCLRSKSITVVEALIRWQVPNRATPLDAGAFIPGVERTLKILDIGKFVVRAALEQAQRWRAEGRAHIRIGINVSVRQLDYIFIDELSDLMKHYGVLRDQVEIEITETSRAHDPKVFQHMIEQIVKLGIRVALDDFGVAYSCMDYLFRIPSHTVKIDQQYVARLGDADMGTNARNDLEKFIAYIHATGRETIAEGVETRDQLRILHAIGCDRVQGYLIARPMPVLQCERYMDEQLHDSEEIRSAIALSA